jgi:pimeloyl-ACP methyl ester carboxylesterase
MPASDPTTHILDVPGARLYYQRRGAGPLLLLIGSPMGHTGFAPLANAIADHSTVVTYDPRGIGNSSLKGTETLIRPVSGASVGSGLSARRLDPCSWPSSTCSSAD